MSFAYKEQLVIVNYFQTFNICPNIIITKLLFTIRKTKCCFFDNCFYLFKVKCVLLYVYIFIDVVATKFS